MNYFVHFNLITVVITRILHLASSFNLPHQSDCICQNDQMWNSPPPLPWPEFYETTVVPHTPWTWSQTVPTLPTDQTWPQSTPIYTHPFVPDRPGTSFIFPDSSSVGSNNPIIFGNGQWQGPENQMNSNRPTTASSTVNRPTTTSRPTATTTTTNRPTTLTTTANRPATVTTVPTSQETTQNPRFLTVEQAKCIRNCVKDRSTRFVCGDDERTYSNQETLNCAQKCGKNVKLQYTGPCVPVPRLG